MGHREQPPNFSSLHLLSVLVLPGLLQPVQIPGLSHSATSFIPLLLPVTNISGKWEAGIPFLPFIFVLCPASCTLVEARQQSSA